MEHLARRPPENALEMRARWVDTTPNFFMKTIGIFNIARHIYGSRCKRIGSRGFSSQFSKPISGRVESTPDIDLCGLYSGLRSQDIPCYFSLGTDIRQ